ncbi:Vacuolar protein sorting-associated protein 72 like protein [Termitomyces sp. J132]|nr:Vacuolar protein sorting-associated protein 72 like protein [Termitomyces sp. J132]
MDEQDTTMDAVEPLVTRRSRRSTAGNRMEAALAEMALDTTVDSVDDDQDFVNDKEEEDVFGSDFESTDEEAQEDTEAGEKALLDEEKRTKKKDARSKVERVTAAAHARQKVTFDPQGEVSTSRPKPKDLKRRVSLGPAVNAETGEVLPVHQPSPKKKRHSQRTHTILATSAAAERLKRSEEKKAAMPKKAKIESKAYTQAELIALALDNEEGNIIDHRDYLKIEEERRKRSRVVRTIIEGPLIRWISRREEIKEVVIPPPSAPTFTPGRAGFVYNSYAAQSPTQSPQTSPQPASQPASQPTSQPTTSSTQTTSQPTTQSTQTAPQSISKSINQSTISSGTQLTSQPSIRPTISSAVQLTAQSSTPTVTQRDPQSVTTPASQSNPYQSTHYNPYIAQLQSASAMMWTPPPPTPVERIEKVTKNYIVHELAQNNGAPIPPWNETMAAMFGDDVDWGALKVYTGKNRPLSRPKQKCPITGKEAKYFDPRTGVPYADLKAYDVLTKLLVHEYAWNPSLRCYVGQDEAGSAPSAL